MNEYRLVLGRPGSLPCNWSWVRITLATGPIPISYFKKPRIGQCVSK
jgi:hypothetical protein